MGLPPSSSGYRQVPTTAEFLKELRVALSTAAKLACTISGTTEAVG